jgi:predicted metalloendopeptidase
MPPRWKTCTRAVDRNLGEALGQEFVRRTFSADTKAKTQLMTEQIETAMQHEIENLDWMSPADQGRGAAQAARDPQQDRLSGQVARLLGA